MKQTQCVRASRRFRTIHSSSKVIDRFILRYCAEPSAKRILGSILAELIDAGRHGLKDVLHDVWNVLVCHAELAAPKKH
jgi:hypothetical protein